jgi:tetratricopeptide (TPR) repeat protein
MTELKILYDKIYFDNQTRDPKQFIDLYEENKILIESANNSITNPDFDGIMRITSDYPLSLSHYGSSRKAIPYLDKAVQMFKNSSWKDLTRLSMYEMLVWTRGVENYNQNKYSLAAKDFQYLVDTYHDNDKYKKWLLASRTVKIKKYLNFFWFGALACLIFESMVKKEDAKFKEYLLIASIILFGFAIATEIINVIIKSKD